MIVIGKTSERKNQLDEEMDRYTCLDIMSARCNRYFFTNKMMYIRKLTDEELIKRESDEGHYHHEEFQQLKKRKCVFLQHLVMIFMAILRRTHIHIQHAPSYFVMASQSVWLIPLSIWNYSKSSDGMWCFMIIEDMEWAAGKPRVMDTTKRRFSAGREVAQTKTRGKCHYRHTWRINGCSHDFVICCKAGSKRQFYIADCPFASFEDQLLYRLKTDFRLSGQWILPLSDRVLKWRDGYSIRQVSPLDVIDQVKEPVLFIHSLHDDYIPCEQSQQLYARKKVINSYL